MTVIFQSGSKWNLGSVKSPRMPYLNTVTVGRTWHSHEVTSEAAERRSFANAAESRQAKGIDYSATADGDAPRRRRHGTGNANGEVSNPRTEP